MKKLALAFAAAGLVSLAACNSTPREQAADNIEANAEATADNIEAMGDNMGGAAESAMDNQAAAVRATGENQAEDMRTHDADTNLSNGI
jgi:hypothetical protein